MNRLEFTEARGQSNECGHEAGVKTPGGRKAQLLQHRPVGMGWAEQEGRKGSGRRWREAEDKVAMRNRNDNMALVRPVASGKGQTRPGGLRGERVALSAERG